MTEHYEIQKEDRDLETKISILDKYAADCAVSRGNLNFIARLFPNEAQREAAQHRLRLMRNEFEYREGAVFLLRETQMKAINEILKDCLVKWDTPRKRELAEFVTEQKMRMEAKLMDITDEFNARIIKAYEDAERLAIPALKERAMERIFETIDSYHDMIGGLQKKFRRVIEEAESKYGV